MGDCSNNEGEGAYIPGDEEVASRQGCFITAEGVANYRVTLPGAHVYIGIVGHNIDTSRAPGLRVPGQPGHPELPDPVGQPEQLTRRHSSPAAPGIRRGPFDYPLSRPWRARWSARRSWATVRSGTTTSRKVASLGLTMQIQRWAA